MSIKLGIVDFDSSHCVEFTRRINHSEIDRSQWVHGARVVMGCPGSSLLSPERVPGFTSDMRQLGIPLVDNPADMLGQVDGVMILSVDGSVHWERARPFIEAGVPCFVDKPFTCSVGEARAMVEAARSRGTPLFSASALRYAPEVTRFVADAASTGSILGATVYGPAPTRARNPGLFHYGIHAVEILFTLMGAECQWVQCARQGGGRDSEESGADVVAGCWPGARLGSVHGIRSGARQYGFVAYCEKTVRHVQVEFQDYPFYRDLLEAVLRFFATGQAPVDPLETLRIMAFIEAASHSAEAQGASRPLQV